MIHKFKAIDYFKLMILGESSQRIIIWILQNGSSWGLKDWRGCSMHRKGKRFQAEVTE